VGVDRRLTSSGAPNLNGDERVESCCSQATATARIDGEASQDLSASDLRQDPVIEMPDFSPLNWWMFLRFRLTVLCAIGFSGLLLVACSAAPSGEPNLSRDFDTSVCQPQTDSVQKTVFLPNCATIACHAGNEPAGSLDLASAGVEARLVGLPATECGAQTLVVPGNPDSSYLVQKIADAKPACGTRMPSSVAALSEGDLQCVRSWIASLQNPVDGSQPDGSVPDGGPNTSVPDGASDGSVPEGGRNTSVPDGASDGSAPDGGPTCMAGMSACPSGCVNTLTDPKNCGTCGNTCSGICSNAKCVAMCPAPTTACAGACVDTSTSSSNCGSCGNVCPMGKTCVAGTCSCGTTVSFSSQLQPILTASCTANGCHSGVMPKANLLLSAGKAYAGLVNAPSSACAGKLEVVPGSVQQSYLMNKLTGVGMCAGTVMPKAGSPLPAGQVDLFRAWICNGAPNN
jgi:hypothetical protein